MEGGGLASASRLPSKTGLFVHCGAQRVFRTVLQTEFKRSNVQTFKLKRSSVMRVVPNVAICTVPTNLRGNSFVEPLLL